MSKLSAKRSVCPVACTLDVIGDRWTLLIIRDLFAGKTQFKEFTESPEHIATNTLTSRLQRLVEYGLAERRVDAEQPSHPEYHLTQKGQSLKPVLATIGKWGLDHIADTEMKIKI